MADRATGPVKPPVIDLTARTASRPDGDKPAANDASPSYRPEAAKPRMPLANANWPWLAGAAVGGAVLGTILTYLVATALPLPSHVAMPPDLTAVVDGQSQQINSLNGAIGDLQKQTSKTQVSLDATITQLDGDMATLNKAIADVKAAMPAAIDLTPLQAQLTTLKAQVDAIGAGASGADAGAIAQSLSDLQASVQSVTTRLNGMDSSIGTMQTDLETTQKSLSDHISSALPNEIGPALKLPLILSGLESAFETGKPFQAELTSLSTIVPGLTIPAPLAAAADKGLSRPDALMQKFEATLPEILAARENSSSDWTQNAVDWAKSLLALRPVEEQDGASPEAIASRLEGAMTRRDYAAASALLGQLPGPMQKAAAPVANDIAAHAAADQLVLDLRSKALASADAGK